MPFLQLSPWFLSFSKVLVNKHFKNTIFLLALFVNTYYTVRKIKQYGGTILSQWKDISTKQLQGNPFEMIGHEWMLITAEKNGKANTMTASWGGLGVMWNKNVAYITIRPQRFTKEFIDGSDTFSLTFFEEGFRKTLGYIGSVSGRDEDKIAKAGLTLVHDNSTPYFEEAKTVVICRKLFAQPYTEAAFLDTSILDTNYPDKDLHTLYIGEITKVLVKE